MTDWETENYILLAGPRDRHLLQELYDKGLIYFANRNLHLFGYAIGVTLNEDGNVIEFNINATDDPNGIWYDEELEIVGRRKLLGANRQQEREI